MKKRTLMLPTGSSFSKEMFRHRNDEAVSDQRALCPRVEAVQIEAPRLADSTLTFLIEKLERRGAGSIGIATNRVVQTTSGVNLDN
jgi:hypothetical protein